MKDAGNARKKRGAYGRVNMRQLPLYDQASTDFPIRSAVSSGNSSSDDSGQLDLTSPGTTDSSRDSELTDYDELIPRNTSRPKKRHSLAAVKANDALSFAAINLFSNYETARSKFQLDVTQLSVLTNFHVGKSTIPILSADPGRLVDLLEHRQW